MSTDCQGCPPPPAPLPCVDCAPPETVSPCLNGEPCDESTWADCVTYRGANLPNINVLTNDRLDIILEKLNLNNTSTGVVTDNTTTTTISGTGLGSDVLTVNVKLDPADDNLIVVTNTGLKVSFTPENTLVLFNTIANDNALLAAFCALIQNCASGTCGIPTGINAVMS